MTKTNYERLGPADQLAIETMLTKAKKEELEGVYKEAKSREAVRKKFSEGDLIAILFLIFIVVLLFGIFIIFDTYKMALENSGMYICQSHNSTYRNVDFNGIFHITVICKDLKIILPEK